MPDYQVSHDSTGTHIREINPVAFPGCGGVLLILGILFLNAIGFFKWLKKNNNILEIVFLIITAIGLLCLVIGIISFVFLFIYNYIIIGVFNYNPKSNTLNTVFGKIFDICLYGFLGCIPLWIIFLIICIIFE